MQLPLEQLGVDHRAGIVDGHQPHESALAGLGIDLDHRELGAERERWPRRLEVRGDHERFAVAARCGAGQLGPADGLRRCARDLQATGHRDEILRVGLELVGREVSGTLEHRYRGLVHRDTGNLHRARAHRAAPGGHHVGVAEHHADVFDRDAESVGDEHRPRGLVALPGRTAAGGDRGPAVVVDGDRARFAAAWRVGDLDVHAKADAE